MLRLSYWLLTSILITYQVSAINEIVDAQPIYNLIRENQDSNKEETSLDDRPQRKNMDEKENQMRRNKEEFYIPLKAMMNDYDESNVEKDLATYQQSSQVFNPLLRAGNQILFADPSLLSMKKLDQYNSGLYKKRWAAKPNYLTQPDFWTARGKKAMQQDDVIKKILNKDDGVLPFWKTRGKRMDFEKYLDSITLTTNKPDIRKLFIELTDWIKNGKDLSKQRVFFPNKRQLDYQQKYGTVKDLKHMDDNSKWGIEPEDSNDKTYWMPRGKKNLFQEK